VFPALAVWALLSGPAAEQPQAVRFEASDGGVVHADVYGAGARGVVLAHGGRFTKESWAPQARALAAAGYRVLAFDFRGYGQSHGPGQEDAFTAPLHLDVLAAARWLRKAGATTVAAIGGSLGGAAVARAAIEEPGLFERIVLLGATPPGPPEKLTVRKLYVMARDDASADGPRLPGLQAHFERAPYPKQLIVVDGSAHAQFLFESPQGERVMREILLFLDAP
jgi:pimeloyl-ACP methyl ester carboxylesterase